jgi:hypothetical protein
MGIIIDKEFQALIPPLSDDEYRQLEENCIRDGIRDPLVTWPQDDGTEILIDGHNRWEISAKNAGIPFKIVQMRFENRAEAETWILKNQIGRRNLPTYVKAQLALRLKPVIAEQAEKNLHLSDGKGCPKSDKVKPIDTKKELARIAGVSHDTIHKVEVIEKNAPTEIKEKARRGEISTNEAYRQTTNIMRPFRKTDIAKEAEEQHAEYQQKKDSGIVSVTDAAVDKENRRILALELSKRVTRAINAVQDISLLKGDQKSIIAELTPEEQGDIRMQLEKLISMLVALNAQIGGANGQI